jgi:hypothetical protein
MRLINRFFLDVFFRAAILIIFIFLLLSVGLNENLPPILLLMLVRWVSTIDLNTSMNDEGVKNNNSMILLVQKESPLGYESVCLICFKFLATIYDEKRMKSVHVMSEEEMKIATCKSIYHKKLTDGTKSTNQGRSAWITWCV